MSLKAFVKLFMQEMPAARNLFIYNMLYIIMEGGKCSLSETQYKTQYRRVYRHLDFLINKALENNNSLFTIEEIRKRIFEETGFHFHVSTLKKYFKKCLDEFGDAPIEELYRLNPRYYERKKVKPPRNYSQSEQD